DARVRHRGRELLHGRAAARVAPDERRGAEGGVAAAAEVQVAVQDARRVDRAARVDTGGQRGVRAEAVEHGGEGEELGVRGQDASRGGAPGEQLAVVGRV